MRTSMVELAAALAVGEDKTRPAGSADERLAGLDRLISRMGDLPPGRDAPVREVTARLGDSWSALILLVLRTGTFRHATLKRVVSLLASEAAISQRMLTLRVRALERDGFVARSVADTQPPRVEYRLTPLGQELVHRFDDLVSWIEANEQHILHARARFSARPAP